MCRERWHRLTIVLLLYWCLFLVVLWFRHHFHHCIICIIIAWKIVIILSLLVLLSLFIHLVCSISLKVQLIRILCCRLTVAPGQEHLSLALDISFKAWIIQIQKLFILKVQDLLLCLVVCTSEQALSCLISFDHVWTMCDIFSCTNSLHQLHISALALTFVALRFGCNCSCLDLWHPLITSLRIVSRHCRHCTKFLCILGFGIDLSNIELILVLNHILVPVILIQIIQCVLVHLTQLI